MIRTVIATSVLVVGLVAALAQSDPIAERKELMTLNGKGFYVDLNRMVRGQAPYDQAKVDAAFEQIVSSAKKIPTLFPDNAKPGAKTSAPPEDKYSASPKVWENKADFEAKNADLVKVVSSVRGNVKNLDSLKSAYTEVAKACDACHETYRLKAN
ncbi:MAG: cytochrome c [Xanthobacteraceae bacterium]|jgi:cytochrome c556